MRMRGSRAGKGLWASADHDHGDEHSGMYCQRPAVQREHDEHSPRLPDRTRTPVSHVSSDSAKLTHDIWMLIDGTIRAGT